MIPVGKGLRGVQTTLIRQIVNAAPAGAINLGLGQPSIDPPAALVAAATAAARGRASYTANGGLPELRERIGAHYNVGADHVLVTAGAQQALFLAMAGLLDEGDEVLVPDPGFPAYKLIADWRGATTTPYALAAEDGFDLDPMPLLKAVSASTRLVVINSPGNPTGTIFSEGPLRRVLRVLNGRNVPVLSDEVYARFDYRDAGPVPLPSNLQQNTMVVSSLSKSFALMGWRMGWLVAPPETIRGLIPLQQMLITCAPVPAQMAGLIAFSPEGEEAVAEVVEAMRTRRSLALRLSKRLPDIPPARSDGAIYLLLDVSSYMGGDDVALAFRLLEHGVITIPGQAFGPGGRGRLRISFGIEPEELEEGLQRLRLGLEAIRGEER